MADSLEALTGIVYLGRGKLGTEWTVCAYFALLVLAGTALLTQPFCNARGEATPVLTAVFTAASAACVTGLTVVDTGTFFSPAGQWVILALIQAGGLGIMTMGTFFVALLGGRLSVKDEFVLMDSLGHDSPIGLRGVLLYALTMTAAFEAAGALWLAVHFRGAYGFEWRDAVFAGVFHSVSAFCNAGFSTFSGSLAMFRTDRAVLLAMAVLNVSGGLGFMVLHNVRACITGRRDPARPVRLTLHSRLAIEMMFCLMVLGAGLFLMLEWNGALGDLDWPDKAMNALFMAITPRTAGFSLGPLAAMSPLSVYLLVLLMFIGGSPASTAGGIKTTTVVVLGAATRALLRGDLQTVCKERGISELSVRKALAVFLTTLALIALFYGVILACDGANAGPGELLFETVSAFGTVGLSMNVTPGLSVFGRMAIVAAMFTGRLLALMISLRVGGQEVRNAVQYPEEDVIVG